MVAKINNGASLFGALTYNIDKVKEGAAYVICSQKIIQNINGNPDLDLSLVMKSFEPYLCLNDRIKKPIVHISLNPDPKDYLTDEQYQKLAEDYLEKIGFKDQPFIVYKHEDLDRHHLHIVTVRVSEEGEKISDAHEHYRSMRACRELEEKYNLYPAIGNKNEFSESYIKKINHEQGNIKRQISNTIRSLCDKYSFHSFGEYNALLSCYNIHAKLVQGERYGEKYNGIVYSVTDNNGTIVSNPFKSSLFGKRFGFNGLEKAMKKSNENLKQSGYPQKIRPILLYAIRKATSKADFIRILKNNHIDVVFRENDNGRIYGVTYIDHSNNMVMNGSRLGKEFSANLLNFIFHQEVKNTATPEPENHMNPEQRESEPEIQPLFEQAFGIFNFHAHGDDPEAKKFDIEQKKRKKKKRGRSL